MAWRIGWKLGLAILVAVFAGWPFGLLVILVVFVGGRSSATGDGDERYGSDADGDGGGDGGGD